MERLLERTEEHRRDSARRSCGGHRAPVGGDAARDEGTRLERRGPRRRHGGGGDGAERARARLHGRVRAHPRRQRLRIAQRAARRVPDPDGPGHRAPGDGCPRGVLRARGGQAAARSRHPQLDARAHDRRPGRDRRLAAVARRGRRHHPRGHQVGRRRGAAHGGAVADAVRAARRAPGPPPLQAGGRQPDRRVAQPARVRADPGGRGPRRDGRPARHHGFDPRDVAVPRLRAAPGARPRAGGTYPSSRTSGCGHLSRAPGHRCWRSPASACSRTWT